MSWTYSGDPANSTRDEVRFLIGDTDSTASYTLADEEINYLLTQATSVLLVAALAAENVAGKIGRLARSKSVGDLSLSWGERSAEFRQLAATLRSRATLSAVKPYVGGLSRTEKDAVDAEADRIAPAHRVGGMDHASSLNDLTTTGT